MSEVVKKNTPCANYRITGCSEMVQTRGNVLCQNCIGLRLNSIQNKRENDDRALQTRIIEMENRLNESKKHQTEKDEVIESLEREKTELNQKLECLFSERKNTIDALDRVKNYKRTR